MMFLARAIVTGFGLSLGAAIFKKVQSRLGLDEPDKKSDPDEVVKQDGAVDPGLQGTPAT
jgi:hypothetical protein